MQRKFRLLSQGDAGRPLVLAVPRKEGARQPDHPPQSGVDDQWPRAVPIPGLSSWHTWGSGGLSEPTKPHLAGPSRAQRMVLCIPEAHTTSVQGPLCSWLSTPQGRCGKDRAGLEQSSCSWAFFFLQPLVGDHPRPLLASVYFSAKWSSAWEGMVTSELTWAQSFLLPLSQPASGPGLRGCSPHWPACTRELSPERGRAVWDLRLPCASLWGVSASLMAAPETNLYTRSGYHVLPPLGLALPLPLEEGPL